MIPFLNLTKTADAPPMALFHGFLESSEIWRMCPNRLWAKHHTVALPLPTHAPWTDCGDLDLSPGSFEFIDLYAEFLERQRPGIPWRLVGHSTGALVALALAHRHPHLVADICAVAPLFSGAVCGRNWQGAFVRLPVVGPMGFQWLMDRWLADRKSFLDGVRTVTAQPKTHLSQLEDMRRDLKSSHLPDLYRLGTWIGGQDLSGMLPEIDRPLHAIICSDDPVVAPRHQLDLLDGLPKASAVLLKSGHLPMVERRKEFARVFLSWRNRHTDSHAERGFGTIPISPLNVTGGGVVTPPLQVPTT